MYKTFNEWFLSLPEEERKVLIENKWLLVGMAYNAGTEVVCYHDSCFAFDKNLPTNCEKFNENVSQCRYFKCIRDVKERLK